MADRKQIQSARAKLVAAMDECERTRAEAQWCHGYRAKGGDTPNVRAKERSWWAEYEIAVTMRDRALRRYVRLRVEAYRG